MAKKFANMCAWTPKTKRGVVTVAYAFLLTNVNEVILRTDAAATILSKVWFQWDIQIIFHPRTAIQSLTLTT